MKKIKDVLETFSEKVSKGASEEEKRKIIKETTDLVNKQEILAQIMSF